MRKKLKLTISIWITFFVGVAFAYFMMISWSRLVEYLGTSNKIWFVSGLIFFLSVLFGKTSIRRVVDRFS